MSGWRRLIGELICTIGLVLVGALAVVTWTQTEAVTWLEPVCSRRSMQYGLIAGTVAFVLTVTLSARLRSDIIYDVHRRHMQANRRNWWT